MPQVHRNGDSRACGASTIAQCNNVFTNNKPSQQMEIPTALVVVVHAANPNVYIGGTLVVIKGNGASP